MNTAKFRSLYSKLNKQQKEAVDTIDGPVMVVAGPGTGKTQVLALRIANILRLTDTSPDSILALTFTNSGVRSMRERLVEIIGSRAYRVSIHTFHSFCNELINRYPEHFPTIIGSRPANQVDELKIMSDIISSGRFRYLKPWNDPDHYLVPCLRAIEKLKKDNLSPSVFKKIVSRTLSDLENSPDLHHTQGPHRGKLRGRYRQIVSRLDKNRELAVVYQRYAKVLLEKKLYDFSDMVMEVIKVVENNEDFRLMLQEEYQYFLADEHQDANQSQNRLLELLSSFHSSPNLFVVGDDKQAIFQFQGASLDNFNYFRHLFPDVRLIKLRDNYRSVQPILDAARSLIISSQSLPAESGVKLFAKTVAKKKDENNSKSVSLYVASNPMLERRFVIDRLRDHLEQGVKPNQLAILYRDNRDAEPIVDELERNGLPFYLVSNDNILEDLDIQKLLILLRSIAHFGKDDYLIPALTLDFIGLDGLDLHRLSEFSLGRQSGRVYDLLREVGLGSTAPPNLENPALVGKLYRLWEGWFKASKNLRLVDFFGLLINESGFLASLLRHSQAIEKLDRLHAFFDELKELAVHPDYSLDHFLDHLAVLEKHRVSLGNRSIVGLEGISVSTVHRAKGLEWDYVYLINAYDGHFGRRRASSKDFLIPTRGEWSPVAISDSDEDERRLFYVALTRARFGVIISYAEDDGRGGRRLPSRFIEEIDKKLLFRLSRSDSQKEIRPIDFPLGRPTGIHLKHGEYLKKLFERRGLSATALNNYLSCPIRYYFQNLLRLVRVKNKNLIYGTAIHFALFSFFENYRQHGRKPSKASILKSFREKINQEPLTLADRTLLIKHGEASLNSYLTHLRLIGEPKFPPLVNELSVRGVLLKLPNSTAKPLRLVGQIDRIDQIDEREVRVIDYKTGRPRGRNELLGLTRGGSGDYWRQLVFYKLLLDRWNNGRYQLTEGEIEFIESDKSGRYHRERFLVTDHDSNNLIKTIGEVTEEIRSLRFLDRGCQDKDCEFCRLWAMSQSTP